MTALAALKALAVSKGVLLGTALSRRGRRQAVDNSLNIVGTGSEDLVSLLSRSEVEQCTQLLFCSKAGDSNIILGKVFWLIEPGKLSELYRI